jgi:hypothetical protein
VRAAILVSVIAMAACGGGGDPAPSVVVMSYTPESLDPADDAADDLTITVTYADGDGDLGGGIATVTDCRVGGIETVLDVPPIASDEAVEAGVPIEGEMVLTVADVDGVEIGAAPAVCVELGAPVLAVGDAAFCVVLTDAGGVSGAGDCTGAIAVSAY